MSSIHGCQSLSMTTWLTDTEYVLSTLDKITNWARQGSMWPMTFGTPFFFLGFLFLTVPLPQVSPAVLSR